MKKQKLIKQDNENNTNDLLIPRTPTFTRTQSSNTEVEFYSYHTSSKKNPHPQTKSAPPPSLQGTNGDRLVLVMCGLPATGKTLIARKLKQYLTFFHSAEVELFNVGQYRRKIFGAGVKSNWFDPNNEKASEQRDEVYGEAMKDMIKWLNTALPSKSPAFLIINKDKNKKKKKRNSIGSVSGKVAIFDATNTTYQRRKWIVDSLEPYMDSSKQVMFIEAICDDEELINEYIKNVTLKMPDYAERSEKESTNDILKRIEYHRKNNEPIDLNINKEAEINAWIRVKNSGASLKTHKIQGYLGGKIVQFLMNLHTVSKPIYLTRHGQSIYNELGKIGGDSSLTKKGDDYAKVLAEFVHSKILNLNKDGSFKEGEPKSGDQYRGRLFTSSLLRAQETSRYIKHSVCSDNWVIMKPRVAPSLDELHAGIFDGFSYKEIQEASPIQFQERQSNKLYYRYPRGESYLDVVERLQPIINELERHRNPICIVSHRAVIRILYCYFKGLKKEQAPFIDIPLNTVIKLTQHTYDCDEERIKLM